jgi:hypothetical protein
MEKAEARRREGRHLVEAPVQVHVEKLDEAVTARGDDLCVEAVAHERLRQVGRHLADGEIGLERHAIAHARHLPRPVAREERDELVQLNVVERVVAEALDLPTRHHVLAAEHLQQRRCQHRGRPHATSANMTVDMGGGLARRRRCDRRRRYSFPRRWRRRAGSARRAAPRTRGSAAAAPCCSSSSTRSPRGAPRDQGRPPQPAEPTSCRAWAC